MDGTPGDAWSLGKVESIIHIINTLTMKSSLVRIEVLFNFFSCQFNFCGGEYVRCVVAGQKMK